MAAMVQSLLVQPSKAILNLRGRASVRSLRRKAIGDLARVGAHVENFVAGEAGLGAGGDVADGVEAGFAAGQADVGSMCMTSANWVSGTK